MHLLKNIFSVFTKKERITFLVCLSVFIISSAFYGAWLLNESSEYVGIKGGVLNEGVFGQPVLINPILATNEADETLVGLLFSPLRRFIDTYEVREDGSLYIVKIKEGLKWDDGEPLTTDDIVFTLKTIQDPLTKSPLQEVWSGIKAERISELQVNIILPRPSLFFYERLSRLLLIPEHVYGEVPPANMRLSEFNLSPVGSGAFRFFSYEKRKDGFISSYSLKPNPYFFGDEPLIEEVKLSFYNKKESVSQAFKVRQVDSFMPQEPLGNQHNFEDSEIRALNSTRYYLAVFNQANPFLSIKEVRKALIESLDQSHMTRNIAGPLAKELKSPLITELYSTNENLQRREEQENEDELNNLASIQAEELGSSTLKIFVPNIELLSDIGENLKDSWNKIGLRTEVIRVNLEDLSVLAQNRTFDVLVVGQILEHPLDLYPFWHSGESQGIGLNLTGYSDARTDILLERVRRTDDTEDLLGMIAEIKDNITSDYPAAFLFTLPYEYVVNNKIGGLGTASSTKDIHYLTPKERFEGIEYWYVAKARIFKK